MFDKNNLHHAYFIEGKKESIYPALLNLLKKDLGFSSVGNPDFFYREFDILKIDEAREIKIYHELKSVSADSHRIFVIYANSITVEAQNSLLKVFEEPFPNTIFFLLAPRNNFLPTLNSRLMKIELATTELDIKTDSEIGENDEKSKKKMILKKTVKTVNYEEIAEEFLNNSVKKRLEITEKITKNLADEKITKEEVISFIDFVAVKCHKKLDKDIKSAESLKSKDLLEKILFIRSYLFGRSPSVKMLLSYLAI
ncbi:MAG: hypothetical protein Q7R78_00375 [bacterium]|nr:hypothetical protein [bacterium]